MEEYDSEEEESMEEVKEVNEVNEVQEVNEVNTKPKPRRNWFGKRSSWFPAKKVREVKVALEVEEVKIIPKIKTYTLKLPPLERVHFSRRAKAIPIIVREDSVILSEVSESADKKEAKDALLIR